MGGVESTGEASSSPRRQRAVANRFSAIERNLRWLQRGLARYPDSDAFVQDWLAEDFEASARVAALERFYDRTVNSINQLIDTVESELVRRGEIADPRRQGGPGRSQRLATYGVIAQGEVADVRRYLERRNVFQKEYPDLGPAAGRDAYEDAEALARLLPGFVSDLRDWASSAGFPI